MSNKDLTRWNRTRLSRIRYIDGNAITYLENVREALQKAFPTWSQVNPSIPPDESWQDTKRRLEAQYFGPRQDWAWEIARCFVRALHILTEHMNAFANEGYLATATQWEYLRRLVDMLDYRPRPPSSASSLMVLMAREDIKPSLVKKGLQVGVTPDDGRPRLVFETLKPYELDPALNELRLKDWNYNPESFDPTDANIWSLPEKHKINMGQVAVLVQDGIAHVVEVNGVDVGALEIKPSSGSTLPNDFIMGEAELWAEPVDVQHCAVNGPNAYRIENAEQYSPGQVVALKGEADFVNTNTRPPGGISE